MRARRPSAAELNLGAGADLIEGFRMFSPLEPSREADGNEHAVSLLSHRTGAPLAEVRKLFAQEFTRLELRAKVRSYLSVLASSNVLARLRHAGTRTVHPDAPKSLSVETGAAVPEPAARPVT